MWGAGTRLTRYVDGIATETRLGRLFAGMLLLGGITSLPEIANVATASSIGNPQLAVNNLLGSASINVVLLAVADAFIGRDAVTSEVANPSTIMMGTLCMLVLIAVAAIVTVGDVLIFGMGVGGLAVSVLSIASFWVAAGYEKRAPWTVKDGRDEPAQADGRSGRPLKALVAGTIVAGGAILAAGYTLSQVGDALAQQTGLGSGLFGFAAIGFSTSMPELSTIVTALQLRRYDMAFGQVLGTNFVNLSLVPLGDAFFQGGPVLGALGRFETVSALLGALLIAIFMVGLLERRNPTVMRMGYDSLAVLILFSAGLALLYFIR